MATHGQPPKLAIVGAAGTVGSQLVELLRERDFAYHELRLFGAPASAHTQATPVDEPDAEIIELESPQNLAGSDMVFLAVPPEAAMAIRRALSSQIHIDLSAAMRPPDADLPLVAPGLVSRQRVNELSAVRTFGVPHPAAQVIATVLRTLGSDTGFAGAVVIASASASGRAGIAKLFNQSADLLNARLDLGDDDTQVAFNLSLPADADELARAITAQVRELTGRPTALTLQMARAPLFHGAAVGIFLPAHPEMHEWAARLRNAPGLVLVEGGEASGTVDAAGQEAVIAKLTINESGATLWCVFDAARLAALTALWIAEVLSA
jgi:aspartate-semialdehyde dehydrogenase